MNAALHKTVNLLPEGSWQTRAPVQWSFLATGIAALVIVAIGLAIAPPPPASAAPPVLATAEATALVPCDDPDALSLVRAASWLPLDELMGRLATLLPPGAQLEELRYRGEKEELHITGTVTEVRHLAELMLALTDFPWLVDTEPRQVERVTGDNRTRFSVRSRVVPFIRVEETKP